MVISSLSESQIIADSGITRIEDTLACSRTIHRLSERALTPSNSPASRGEPKQESTPIQKSALAAKTV